MEVHENKIEHLDDFIRLNEQWIKKYFELELVDFDLAADPAIIIKKGGYIFTLTHDNNVVCACALFNDGEGVFELARMAVAPYYQGKRYGQILMETCLSKLADLQASKVYLVSNTQLVSAITLYKKFGFETSFQGPHPIYSRADIVMERRV